MPRVSITKRTRFHKPLLMTQKVSKRTNRPPKNDDKIQVLRDTFSSRWLSVSALRDIENNTGLRFKRGKFSDPEKSLIRKSLDEFLSSHGLTLEDFVKSFFLNKRESGQFYEDERFKEVFKFVAMKLEGRPILMTYQCMRRMFHPGNKKGLWTAEEDAELKRLFEIHGPDWETIGLSIGRYGVACRDRYKLFRGKHNNGRWSAEEVQRLADAVSEVRRLSDGRPCWIFVSERVGTRTITQCLIKWMTTEAYQKNLGATPKWTRELDHHLISRIYDLGVEHESEINWRDLSDEDWPVKFSHISMRNRFYLLRKRVYWRPSCCI